ncbi:MAG: hypothetical protein ACXW13_06585 [Burkholderiaceae bacterium]
MTTRLFRRQLLTAALGAFVCAPAVMSQPAATGPWAKVPAFPTVCYSGNDPFSATIEAARTAAQADLYKQQAVNAKIKEAYQKIDPMEMATRMQKWMMSNPQEAAKSMQMAQAAGAESQGNVEADAKQKKALDDEWSALTKRYDAALTQAYAASEARWRALLTKAGMPYHPTIGFGAGESPSPAVLAEHKTILAQRDKEYQAACPQWWGAAGAMPAYLKKYQTWLAQQHVPYLDKFDAANVQTYAIMNTPAAAYRSTSTLQSVVDYLGLVQKVFDRRPTQPYCGSGAC